MRLVDQVVWFSASHSSNTARLDEYFDHKGCLTRDGMLHMMFKLGQCAEKTWRRFRGFKQLPKVIKGIQFPDGIEEKTSDPVAA